jgi:hypothetical protein
MAEAIKWGPDIRVGGNRPDFVQDDDLVMHRGSHPAYQYPYDVWFGADGSYEAKRIYWANTSHIRLLASHPYYLGTVTLPFMTEGEVRSLATKTVGYVRHSAGTNDIVEMFRAVGVIAPAPLSDRDAALEEAAKIAEREHSFIGPDIAAKIRNLMGDTK